MNSENILGLEQRGCQLPSRPVSRAPTLSRPVSALPAPQDCPTGLNHLHSTETQSFDSTKWQSHAKETSPPHYSGVQGPKGQDTKVID